MKLNNWRQILALFTIIVCLGACGKDEEPLTTVLREIDFEIPAGLGTIETHNFVTQTFNFGISEQLNALNISEESVSRIQSRQGLLVAKFANIDWEFVNNISVEAVSRDGSGDRTELFYMDPVPFNVDQEIELFPSLPNLKDVVLNDLVDLEIKMRFRNFTPTNIESRLTMEFSIFDTE